MALASRWPENLLLAQRLTECFMQSPQQKDTTGKPLPSPEPALNGPKPKEPVNSALPMKQEQIWVSSGDGWALPVSILGIP